MRCPVCDDDLPASAERCTFCGYDFRTGKRGAVAPPAPGAVASARRQGMLFLAVGVPAVLGAALLLFAPSLIVRVGALLVALPAAAGLCARGLNSLGQARRWELKQRLYDEAHVAVLPSGGSETSVGVR